MSTKGYFVQIDNVTIDILKAFDPTGKRKLSRGLDYIGRKFKDLIEVSKNNSKDDVLVRQVIKRNNVVKKPKKKNRPTNKV